MTGKIISNSITTMNKSKSLQLLREIYKQVREQEVMQGTYLKARDVGPGLIEKTPIQNRNFTPKEVAKFKFMELHPQVFAQIVSISPNKIKMEKLEAADWNQFKDLVDYYVSVAGEPEEVEDFSMNDSDIISDFMMHNFFMPRSKFDFKWLRGTLRDALETGEEDEDEYIGLEITTITLINYQNRINKIKKWPTTSLDIHIDNVGYSKDGDLKIFDF